MYRSCNRCQKLGEVIVGIRETIGLHAVISGKGVTDTETDIGVANRVGILGCVAVTVTRRGPIRHVDGRAVSVHIIHG